MLTGEVINEIIGINENYEMPTKLMEILEDKEQREQMFDKFMEYETDLSYDWFTNYFQEEHADREKLKQDFTPNGIAEIVGEIGGRPYIVCDICSGTGGLTIKEWAKNKDAFFHCEEVASSTIPMLLFNLAIRGVNGEVVHCDVLENKTECVYKLTNNGKYSDIEKTDTTEMKKADKVISNPPYSLKWSGGDINDIRFKEYGLAPKSKADFAFVLHGLYNLEEHATMLCILPHGVLFRGAAEGKIRQKLIENNIIDAVIGLPDKLFLNTSIPTCILVLRKKKTDNNILFIDASKEYKQGKKQNELTVDNVDKIVDTYEKRKNVDKYSHLVTLEEIKKNDFNLNIPRYVDTTEPEPLVNLAEVIQNLAKTEQEIRNCEMELAGMLRNMYSTDGSKSKELEMAINFFEGVAK